MGIVLFDSFQAVKEGIARTGAFFNQPGLPERLSQNDINDE